MQDQVAVLHSNLSQGERFDEWHRIRKGTARIVIGARSAVFAPLPDLGLILVDEEHENTYKQENVPRYHGRDVAVLRAAFEPCAIVLGSATPSLESWHNTLDRQVRTRSASTSAPTAQSMPLVRVVDMRLEAAKHKGGPPFSPTSCAPRSNSGSEKGEQSILFLNRRGFARSLQCPPAAMSASARIAPSPSPITAPTSGSSATSAAIRPSSRASARSAATLPSSCRATARRRSRKSWPRFCPKAKIARIDADAMRRKNALRDTLNAFKAHKIDILIGTQMIAKGLHFPNVTLVGILNADLGLHVPDFRAGERTFQLITQVAGRAGRGDLEGEVIVQTFTPHSPSIQYARQHDFDGFSEQEMEFRRAVFASRPTPTAPF